MWKGILLIVVLFVIYRFLKDARKDVKRSAQSGGVRLKFGRLIKLIQDSEPYLKVTKQNQSTIILKGELTATMVTYNLLWSFHSLTVLYSLRSRMTGKHSFELVLNETMDQEEMYAEIKNKLSELQNKINII